VRRPLLERPASAPELSSRILKSVRRQDIQPAGRLPAARQGELAAAISYSG
jgi:hypothetical protein